MKHFIDERFLVSEVLARNRSAFKSLVQQYEALVLHIVTPIIGVNADREDICQDVFIKVYEKLDTFQFKSKLSTWIGNIAYNTSINFIQKKRNILLGDLFPAEDGEAFIEVIENDTPENIIIKKEDMSRLKTLVNALPPVQKLVLLLFHYDELSLDEISKTVEMPVNTVKSHLFRAKKSLRESLNK